MRDFFRRFFAPDHVPEGRGVVRSRAAAKAETLPDRDDQRAMVRALFLAGFDTREIAGRLDVHESLVVRLHDEARAAEAA